MTIFTSQMISGAVGQQLGMFSGYGGYAQQINPMMGMGMMGMGFPQAQMMPQLGAIGAMRRGMGGVYGEQAAMRMANIGQTAMGVGAAGLGMMAAFSPIPMDPISGAMMGARFGMGGAALGAAGGAALGLPLFAATQAAQVYGGAFTGGMQDQAALNSTLRNNFQHFGGQGAFGRGFSQNQMGQIGSMISGELRRNPFTSNQELSGLIAGGAEAGQFTAVRDVQQFTQRFRQMLNTLKDVQRELGGTLTDALQFVRGAQQAGIFRNADQVNFASEVRSAEAVTGMDRNQLIALSAQGAQISRAFGGVGRQGAMGALRGAQTLGAAVQAGIVNQEMLSEATGGLQGAEAIGAFTQNMLARSGRFSRTGMGRFSLFAMSNDEGTGLDQGMMDRFMSGDLSVGEVSRTAHRRVGRMGRARALNREGMIRGAVMEQGGMAAQIGMMRLLVGDRVLDQSDDMASLVMQRRFHMSRPESELMINLMRNQGSIATEEAMTRRSSSRSTALSREITENRSFDGFMRHLEHGLADSTGVTRARELGRSFMTRISSLAERAMNDILGVTASQLGSGDEAALNRMFLGRANAADISRLDTGGRGGDSVNAQSLFAQPLAGQALHALGLHGASTPGEMLARRGVRGLSGSGAGATARDAVEQARAAQQGLVMGDSRLALDRLEANEERTMRQISQARLMAAGLGDSSRFYQLMGGDANATDAFMASRGMRGMMGGVPSLAGVGGGGQLTGGMVGRDALRILGLVGGLVAAPLTGGLSLAATAAAGTSLFSNGGLESMQALQTPTEGAASFFAGGNASYRQALERRARGTTAEDVRETISYMQHSMEGRPTEEVEAAIQRTLAREDNRAALLLEGASGVTRESVEAIMGSEEFQRRSREILGAGEGLGDRLEALRRWGGTLEDAGQQQAVLTIADQIEQGAGPNGEISGPLRQALEASGFDPRRVAEIRTRRADMAAEYRSMARGLASAGAGDLASLFEGAGTAMSGTGNPTEQIDAVRMALSRMGTEGPEYEAVARAMGRTEGGRAFLAAASQDRQLRRDLSGRGRRGSAGAAEAAFGAATGGALSEMEFSVGGRTISGSDRNAARRLAAILSRGGEDAGTITRQLQAQLEGRLGLSAEEAGNLSTTLSTGLQAGRGGVMNAAAVEDLIRQSGSEGLSRVRREGAERMARDRDPLGAQRNDLLRSMDQTLRTISEQLPQQSGGMSRAEAG